ncbi:MAG: coagulation factor 5/8 type domain-containing protein [Acidobacteria bacterium]|nr:coagulation factor 5/8 type domain-containing protein [Acidobacteriota bacterium]
MKLACTAWATAVLTASTLALASAHAQVPLENEGATSSVEYSTLQHITGNDSNQMTIEKAATVLPRRNQTDWMRLERTFFIHFGPNTFRGVEWGNGHEDPSVFNPTQLDADQWVRTVRDGGGKMVILVCKHHDGFNLWPTRYSDHSVAFSPWEGGKGNLVRDVAAAARKYNIKLGIYLSPADLYQLRTNLTNPNGYYGNESPQLSSTIPTDPAAFKVNPSKGRKPPVGFGSFQYRVDDYNRYFLNELYELLTEYGRIDEVWFDGANPDPSVQETYDYNAWYDMIRHLQPHAIIFGKGPDGRWVGNESGVGRTTEWSVIPLPTPPDQFRWPDMREQDLGSRSKLVPGSYLWWYPAETNVPILHGWFWAADKSSRTAAELVDTYYQSVGRNSNWLLNLSPDNRGLIPDLQVANVSLMNQVITETFARNLAEDARLTADTSQRMHLPSAALDGDLDTWWEAAPGHSTATVTLKLSHPATFDVISLQEAVDHRSQRIESFAVDVKDGSQWKQIDEQTTVGHKRLLRLGSPVTTDEVRIRITGSRTEPTLAEIGLFKQAELVQAPAIGNRDARGDVSISSPKGLPVVYTVDGTVPTDHSAVYRAPIPLADGGKVLAACIAPDGRLGMLALRDMPGLAPIGWKIVNASSESPDHPAFNAIDGNPNTLWETGAGTAPTGEITVDTRRVRRVLGFTYLPRQDHDLSGIVEKYRFETSVDGKTWFTNVSSGSFENIRNNPELQKVFFPMTDLRFFRFTALDGTRNAGKASAAEISVILAPETTSQRDGSIH